jgi:hypothetical protein
MADTIHLGGCESGCGACLVLCGCADCLGQSFTDYNNNHKGTQYEIAGILSAGGSGYFCTACAENNGEDVHTIDYSVIFKSDDLYAGVPCDDCGGN